MTYGQFCDWFKRSFPEGTHNQDQWRSLESNEHNHNCIFLYDLKPTRASEVIKQALVEFAIGGTMTRVRNEATGEVKEYSMREKTSEEKTWASIAFMQGFPQE